MRPYNGPAAIEAKRGSVDVGGVFADPAAVAVLNRRDHAKDFSDFRAMGLAHGIYYAYAQYGVSAVVCKNTEYEISGPLDNVWHRSNDIDRGSIDSISFLKVKAGTRRHKAIFPESGRADVFSVEFDIAKFIEGLPLKTVHCWDAIAIIMMMEGVRRMSDWEKKAFYAHADNCPRCDALVTHFTEIGRNC